MAQVFGFGNDRAADTLSTPNPGIYYETKSHSISVLNHLGA